MIGAPNTTSAEVLPPRHESGARHSLEVKDLRKTYRGRAVVDGVSLGLASGEIVGLLGPNGAGKTTTFYMVVGLARPDQGSILYDGRDITVLPMYRRARMGIGYLPQEPSVFRKMAVEENILAVLEMLPLSPEGRRARLADLLEDLGIAHLARHRAYALSGGERRRVEIARALALSPEFILLDEPFAGIDPITVSEIQKIVARLKSRGIGVFITDHNVAATLKITDRAYIINEGKILKEGTPAEIAASAQVRAAYLGEDFSF